MTWYVVLAPEAYDQYEVDRPVPVRWAGDAPSLTAALQVSYNSVVPQTGSQRAGYRPNRLPGFRLSVYHVEESYRGPDEFGYRAHRFKAPRILTLDEWLEEASGA